MPPPVTPRRTRAADDEEEVRIGGTPNARRRTEMSDDLRDFNDEQHGRMANFLDSVNNFIHDLPNPELVEAAKFAVFGRLRRIDDPNLNPLDVFLDEEMRNRAQELLELEEDITGNKSDDENARDSDREDRADDDANDGQPRHRRRGADQPTTNEELTEEQLRVKAYRDLQWINGDGSHRTRAVIVGTVRDPGTRSELRLPVDADTTIEDMNNKREEFELFLEELRWFGARANRRVWMRLHPWSIRLLSELFFVSFIGTAFFRSTNAITSSVFRHNDDGVSRTVAFTAERYIEDNADILPPVVKEVFAIFAEVVRSTFGHDAFTHAAKQLQEVHLLRRYSDFVTAVESDLNSPEARFLSQQGGIRLGARGVGIRTVVKQYFSNVLKLEATTFNRVLNRAAPAMSLHEKYGDIVVMILPKGMISTIAKVGIGALPQIINRFDELVPSFSETIHLVNQKLVPALSHVTMTPEDARRLEFPLGTARARGSWKERIMAVLDDITITEEEDDQEMADSE